MPVSDERRAALRAFFEDSQRGIQSGIAFVAVAVTQGGSVVGDILGVLDDLDAAAASASALRSALSNEANLHRDGAIPIRYENGALSCGIFGHENDRGCVYWQETDRLLASSDSSTAAEQPKAEAVTDTAWECPHDGPNICNECAAREVAY